MGEQLCSRDAVHCVGIPRSTGFVSPLSRENHEEFDEFHDDTLSDKDFLALLYFKEATLLNRIPGQFLRLSTRILICTFVIVQFNRYMLLSYELGSLSIAILLLASRTWAWDKATSK